MKKIFLSIAFAATLVGCSNDELANWNNEPVELKALVENSTLSRVGFDKANSWSFFWHNEDQIWVNGGVMSTADADKSPTANFTGYGVNTASGYAAYPYEGTKLSGDELTIKFPSTYSAVDSDYFESAQNIAMYAVVENGAATFKHLGGVFVFRLNGWNVTGDQVFTFTSSHRITGEFTADLTADTPVLVTDDTASEDVVTVSYSTAETGDIVFYVPVPTGTYDVSLKITAGGTVKFSKSYEDLTVNRTSILYAEFGESSLVGGGGSTVENEETLTEALQDGGEIKLGDEISVQEDLTVSVNTVIDLNGNNLDLASGKTIKVAEGVSLTIKDSQTPSVYARSAVAGTTISGSGDIVTASNNSKIIIGEGVNLTSTENCCIFVPQQVSNVEITTAGNLTAGGGYAAIQAGGTSNNITVHITGGTITSACEGVYFPCTTNLNISGGTIVGTTAVYHKSGELNISGGVLKGTGEQVDYVYNGNGCNATGDALVIEACNYPGGVPVVSITGGEFISENAKAIGYYQQSESCKLANEDFITGGTFSDASAFDYLADNASVTVGANLNLTSSIVVDKNNITISLNDKNIVSTGDVFEVVGGTLTIQGDGYVKAGVDGDKVTCNAVYARDYAVVNIQGGSYYVDGQDGNDCIYAKNGTTINISNGTFESKNAHDTGNGIQHWVLNCRGKEESIAESNIIVTGGTFINFNPACNVSEGKNTNFVAEGYQVLCDGNVATGMHDVSNDRKSYVVSAQ